MEAESTVTGITTVKIFDQTVETLTFSQFSDNSWLQLYHGTGFETVNWILENGLSFERMNQYCNATVFWTTAQLTTAVQYSYLNIDVNNGRDRPAVLKFKVPMAVVKSLQVCTPSLVVEEAYEAAYGFHPGAFEVINSVMTDQSVIDVASLAFDE